MKPESGWTGNLQLCLEGYQAVRFAVPTPAGLCALCWGFVIIPECQRGSLSLGPRARTRVEMVLMKSHHLDHGTATAWPCVLTTCNPPAVIPIPADQLCPVLVAQREPSPAAEHPMPEQGRGLFSISFHFLYIPASFSVSAWCLWLLWLIPPKHKGSPACLAGGCPLCWSPGLCRGSCHPLPRCGALSAVATWCSLPSLSVSLRPWAFWMAETTQNSAMCCSWARHDSVL